MTSVYIVEENDYESSEIIKVCLSDDRAKEELDLVLKVGYNYCRYDPLKVSFEQYKKQKLDDGRYTITEYKAVE
jgi:hypothetical protein